MRYHHTLHCRKRKVHSSGYMCLGGNMWSPSPSLVRGKLASGWELAKQAENGVEKNPHRVHR